MCKRHVCIYIFAGLCKKAASGEGQKLPNLAQKRKLSLRDNSLFQLPRTVSYYQ